MRGDIALVSVLLIGVGILAGWRAIFGSQYSLEDWAIAIFLLATGASLLIMDRLLLPSRRTLVLSPGSGRVTIIGHRKWLRDLRREWSREKYVALIRRARFRDIQRVRHGYVFVVLAGRHYFTLAAVLDETDPESIPSRCGWLTDVVSRLDASPLIATVSGFERAVRHV